MFDLDYLFVTVYLSGVPVNYSRLAITRTSRESEKSLSYREFEANNRK